MKKTTVTTIKIILILLLVVCLFKWSYGVYVLCRVLLAIGFGLLAYKADKEQNETGKIIFIVLILIFQPIFKIPFGRTIWQTIDVLVAVGLIYSMIKPSTSKLIK